MKVTYLSYPFKNPIHFVESSIAIGNFDGIHKGHQKVIKTAIEKSKKYQLQSGVMTFYPHPKEVLGKTGVTSITPLEDKLRIFGELGVDVCYVVEFNEAFAKITKDMFIHDFLIPLKVLAVTVGFDFHFGRFGQGNPEDFITAKRFLSVDIIESIDANHEKISSTNIRSLIKSGGIEHANFMLGRNHKIRCEPVEVYERNRLMNISHYSLKCKVSQGFAFPKSGSYTTIIKKSNEILWGIASFSNVENESDQSDLEMMELDIVGDLDFTKPYLEVYLLQRVNVSVDTEIKQRYINFVYEEHLSMRV
ncbi:FAD synthetase family protein [Alkalihalobacterium alkalinitrilicum]|uniref:FAD synthetase family protein n=1 Tax=Alkalihalobacterium alkalinitrilicum TaxID=427920 RepID=UPI0009950ACB|nr:FAD synthetase family protein [Alkalihalobacterium alkalinitrilicum]